MSTDFYNFWHSDTLINFLQYEVAYVLSTAPNVCSYTTYKVAQLSFLLWSVFVCWNGTSDFAKAGQVSDDTITLISY